MEDDIDIEEHDVLDNPKIRDIFPDLSLVKIEVPDSVEDTPGQYQVPLQFESDEEYGVTVKKETISDEENNTDHCVQNDRVTCEFDQNERSSNEIGERGANTYGFRQNKSTDDFDELPYNNKIILGSKPVPDYDILYEEALHSNVTVSLENWELKLKNSLCYCNDCEILFSTVNALDAHNSVSHSFLVALDTPRPNTARKSTTMKSSRYCNHCDKIFTDDTALIKHLYELLPLNNFRKPTPEPLKIDAKSTRYKCTKCRKYFATFAAGKEHKKNVHPTLSNLNIICKVVAKTEASDEVAVKKEVSDKKSVDSLVPKSVLFQCHICHINFVSCYSATQHSIKCTNSTEYQKCRTCKRKIRAKDSYIHAMQHRYALPGAKLKIYTLHKNISEKVYVKCPICSICFDERAFWPHYGLCDSQRLSSVRCTLCCIDIVQSRYPNHKSKHTMQKYTKKDFIIIKFYDVNQINATETQMEVDTISEIQSDNLGPPLNVEKIPLYYCKTCGSCKTFWSIRGHKNGTCKTLSVKFCDLCGLGFSKDNYKEHKTNHHGKRVLALNDFKIMNINTGKEIEIPMSNFHSCKRCKIHFLSREKIKLHNCTTEQYKLCEICNKKFNLRAFGSHSNFHTHSNIPELLKKYNSINDMWNVIYSCTACHLVTMTYDSAVEHSQNHINELPKPSFKKCDICNFDIIEPHYMPHMKLHKNEMMIDRSKFRILTFDFKNIFTTEWMTIFSSLPKVHKYQILSKSIYRYARNFKFNYVIDCRSDDVMTYCEKCKTGVHLEHSRKHYLAKKCKVSSSYVCRTCDLHFSTIHDCILHEKNHNNVPKTCKVITFNDNKDILFNQRLREFEVESKVALLKAASPAKPSKTLMKPPSKTLNKSPTKTLIKPGTQIKASKTLAKGIPTKPPSKLVKRIVKFKRGCTKRARDEVLRANRIKLFKCEKCGSCVSLKKNVSKHCCVYHEKRRKLCPLCKEYFYGPHLHIHMELHRHFPHVNKKPLVIPFNLKSSTVALPIANIYQCDCGLNFTSKLSIDKHLEICSNDLEISKETCSKCNLLFPTDVLVTHLCKHHSKPMDIQVQLIRNKNSGPVKCAKCSIIYPNMTHFDEHLFTCGGKIGKVCLECNFKFEASSFSDHKCLNNKTIPIVKKSASISTVFRCLKCNITYLSRKSINYHFDHNHITCREVVTCNICKLRFTSMSLLNHKALHSSGENYIIKVVDPSTGRSTIRRGKNRVINTSNQRTKNKERALNEATKKNIDESTEEVDENMLTENNSKSNEKPYRVYKCVQCETCYRLKKRLEHHIKSLHVTKRGDLPCDVCGLKFHPKLTRKHRAIHENGDLEYKIIVIESDTGKPTVLKGKNPVPRASANKRSSNFTDYSASRSKRPRRNDSNIQDIPDEHIDSQDEEPSTSKFDFESVDMTADGNETILSDMDSDNTVDTINVTNDPLHSTDSILPDTKIEDENENNSDINKDKMTENAHIMTDKLKMKLNANMRNYSSRLFKCKICGLHYLVIGSILWHLSHHNRPVVSYNCKKCGLNFTHATLKRHVYIHHTRMKLKKCDFKIKVLDESVLKLPYRLQVKIGDLLPDDDSSSKLELPQDVETDNVASAPNVDRILPDNENDDVTHKIELETDSVASETNVGHILPDDNDTDQIDLPTDVHTDNVASVNNTKIHYYKCRNCNVCFIDEITCREHCLVHTELDPKTYIECKICNFQFLIDSLKSHVNVHHVEEFFLEDLVITEYTATEDNNPHVEVYQGIDKVQSRLVSTTTDVTADSLEKDIIGI